MIVLCFFFSSRRRHTRLQGDWSSDVCSSDLQHAVFQVGALLDQRRPGTQSILSQILAVQGCERGTVFQIRGYRGDNYPGTRAASDGDRVTQIVFEVLIDMLHERRTGWELLVRN